MKKNVYRLLGLFLAILMLAGCAPQQSEQPLDTPSIESPKPGESAAPVEQGPKPEGEGTLLLSSSRSLETLNQQDYAASETAEFLDFCVGVLYRYTPAMDGLGYSLKAELADGEPVQMDSEGLVWQVKIHPDAKFANGEPINADAYMFTFKTLLDPKLANAQAATYDDYNIPFKNAKAYFGMEEGVTFDDVGIKKVDDLTLEFTFETALTAFTLKNGLSTSVFGPLYEPLYTAGMNADGTESTYGTEVAQFMSSGPYMCDYWQQGGEYSCVKNPNFINPDEIWLAGIQVSVLTEGNSKIQMFESGQLHVVSLTEATREQYMDDPRLVDLNGSSVQRVAINVRSTAKPILGNLKFRQALAYASNKPQIGKMTSSIGSYYIIPTGYMIDPENGTTFRSTPEGQAVVDNYYQYDPELAKKLFDEALAEEGLTSLELQLDYHDGNESRKMISEFFQSEWARIFGADKFKLNLQAVPSSQLSAKLRAFEDDNNAFELGWTGSSFNLFDAGSILSEFPSDVPRRKGPTDCPEFDALYEAMAKIPLSDIAARTKAIAAAEEALLKDASFLPGYESLGQQLLSDDVIFPMQVYYKFMNMGYIWAKIAE